MGDYGIKNLAEIQNEIETKLTKILLLFFFIFKMCQNAR